MVEPVDGSSRLDSKEGKCRKSNQKNYFEASFITEPESSGGSVEEPADGLDCVSEKKQNSQKIFFLGEMNVS